MNDAEVRTILEKAWQRAPTPSELAALEAWLAAHPEARSEWQVELALSEALRRMEDVPVSSNFTHRVRQAIDQPTPRPSPSPFAPRLPSWLRWLPRFAVGMLVVGMGWIGYRHHEASERSEMAGSVQEVSRLASMPVSAKLEPVEVWQDFDAIRGMNTTGPDTELLALLQ
jgi:anti-sigma factor RsiW